MYVNVILLNLERKTLAVIFVSALMIQHSNRAGMEKRSSIAFQPPVVLARLVLSLILAANHFTCH